MKKKVALYLLSVLTLAACKKSSENSSLSAKPKATGEVGKVAVLINDATYVACKDTLKAVYQKTLEGLPSLEPYLRVTHCNEDKFTNYFKRNYNLCIVYDQSNSTKLKGILGGEMTTLINEKIKNGESIFVVKDLFAQPQEVCFILAANSDDLNKKLVENGPKLLELAMATEKKTTISRVIRKPKNQDAFYNTMMKQYGYAFRTPANFKVSVRSDEFNGVNRTAGDKRSGMYLYEEPYKGDHQFELDYIIQRRNDMLKRHLHGPDRPDSIPTYVSTDTVNVTPYIQQIDLNGYKAFETRGWWEMENEFFGGPFISYTIFCPKQNKVVTLEANVFAPSEKKQPLLRQMELAATTFEEK